MQNDATNHARTYGDDGPLVLLLHGGPGAPGYLAPLARRLSDSFRVVEPFQRASGSGPLTLARHAADLQALIEEHSTDGPPRVVGHSWGAMLALAHAAEHPGAVQSLALIGCGTFDRAARERMLAIRRERMSGDLAAREERLMKRYPSPDDRLKALGKLYQVVDSVALMPHSDESAAFDAAAHEESWADMIRLQDEGVYPAAFSAIRAPVLMLHGADDPHPGPLIRDSLTPHLPQLEYQEFERCGHYPWIEQAAHEAFYAELRAWLTRAS